jgi:asparagine synthetase B (glutamine-hydrolysing)
MPKIETYSIGMEGSEDLKYANECAKFLKTKHTNIVLSRPPDNKRN